MKLERKNYNECKSAKSRKADDSGKYNNFLFGFLYIMQL